MEFFYRFTHDRCGTTAAEYALILAIIGGAIAGAALLLATTEAQAIGTIAKLIMP